MPLPEHMTHEKETQSVLFIPMSLELHLVVQLLCCVCLFVTPWTAACQASLSFTISQILLKLMSIKLVMAWCHPTISSSVLPFSCLKYFPASGSFPMSQLFALGGQSIEASALASVLPVNIQGWFPLWLTGLILLSKGLSSLLQHHNSKASVLQHSAFFYCPALTSVHGYWKNHRFDYMDLCQQSDVSVFLMCCLGLP